MTWNRFYKKWQIKLIFTSPDSSSIKRSTPWAAGWHGPKLIVIVFNLRSRCGLTASRQIQNSIFNHIIRDQIKLNTNYWKLVLSILVHLVDKGWDPPFPWRILYLDTIFQRVAFVGYSGRINIWINSFVV